MSTHAKSETNNVNYYWLGKEPNNIAAITYIQRIANVLRAHMFKIHIKVKYTSGQTTLVLFNGVEEKLLDTSAHKFVNRLSIIKTIVLSQILTLCGMDFAF